MENATFKKDGITVEHQVRINDEISDLVNVGKEDAVIIYHLEGKHGFTIAEARKELSKAKAWMGWYARA